MCRHVLMQCSAQKFGSQKLIVRQCLKKTGDKRKTSRKKGTMSLDNVHWSQTNLDI